MFKRLLSIAKNKFVLASLAFIIWMLFFDSNDFASQLHYKKQRTNLQQEKLFYENEIKSVEKKLEELSNDPKMLEKFAREKYLMKRENEDLYVIITE